MAKKGIVNAHTSAVSLQPCWYVHFFKKNRSSYLLYIIHIQIGLECHPQCQQKQSWHQLALFPRQAQGLNMATWTLTQVLNLQK